MCLPRKHWEVKTGRFCQETRTDTHVFFPLFLSSLKLFLVSPITSVALKLDHKCHHAPVHKFRMPKEYVTQVARSCLKRSHHTHSTHYIPSVSHSLHGPPNLTLSVVEMSIFRVNLGRYVAKYDHITIRPGNKASVFWPRNVNRRHFICSLIFSYSSTVLL